MGCKANHLLNQYVGTVSVRWCEECRKYSVRLWARDSKADAVANLVPEWTTEILIADDEWTERSLLRAIRAVAATIQLMERDEAAGQLRLTL